MGMATPCTYIGYITNTDFRAVISNNTLCHSFHSNICKDMCRFFYMVIQLGMVTLFLREGHQQWWRPWRRRWSSLTRWGRRTGGEPEQPAHLNTWHKPTKHQARSSIQKNEPNFFKGYVVIGNFWECGRVWEKERKLGKKFGDRKYFFTIWICAVTLHIASNCSPPSLKLFV